MWTLQGVGDEQVHVRGPAALRVVAPCHHVRFRFLHTTPVAGVNLEMHADNPQGLWAATFRRVREGLPFRYPIALRSVECDDPSTPGYALRAEVGFPATCTIHLDVRRPQEDFWWAIAQYDGAWTELDRKARVDLDLHPAEPPAAYAAASAAELLDPLDPLDPQLRAALREAGRMSDAVTALFRASIPAEARGAHLTALLRAQGAYDDLLKTVAFENR